MKGTKLALIAVLGLIAAGCRPAGDEQHERRESLEKAEKTAPAGKKPEENDRVKLAEDAIVLSKLQTVEVRSDSGFITTRFPGNIEFNRNATAVVQSPLEGRLQEWLVNIGDALKKDHVVARIDSPQNLGTPILLKAPIDGAVVERNASLGDWVKPGDKLAVITDSGTLWATAHVREDMVGKVLTDQPAAIRVLAFPDETFPGKLLRVGASVDPETRMVDYVFSVPNAEGKLRAGMFAQLSLATDRVQDKILAPDDAIQIIHDRSVVFVEEKRGEYRVRSVRLGRKLGESHEVLEGLKSGERIVTAGSFILKSEALRSEFSGEQE